MLQITSPSFCSSYSSLPITLVHAHLDLIFLQNPTPQMDQMFFRCFLAKSNQFVLFLTNTSCLNLAVAPLYLLSQRHLLIIALDGDTATSL